MPVPPRWVRRLLVAPLVVLLELVTLALSPVLLLVAALASPFFGGWRPLRLTLLVLVFAARHLTALIACLGLWLTGRSGDEDAHYAVLRRFVSGIYGAVVRLARVEVRVHASEEAEAALSGGGRPAVVLYRHAGEGDSLLAVHQLLCWHARRPRVVMHDALRVDPLIDVLGSRLPNKFLDPRGGDTEREIAAMSTGLGPGDTVLIFPEGGNVTEERRRRGIERLEQAGHAEEAAWARDMRHVIAPRPGGALAAIDAAADADVVFVGHVGFPTGFRELWELLPHRQTVHLRLWLVPAAEVPGDRDEQIDWLFQRWGALDRWIGERQEQGRRTSQPADL
jgi:1-acyl-sn-glycerol-3-phosphate acyltransferase